MMRRIIICFVSLSLVLFCLTACSNNSETLPPEEDPTSELYDWDRARISFIEDLSYALDAIFAGSAAEYSTARTAWDLRVSPATMPVMFSRTPPEGCVAALVYIGYSAAEYNSLGSEYLLFTVTRTNSETLFQNKYNVLIKLGRGNTGYFVDGYTQEVIG